VLILAEKQLLPKNGTGGGLQPDEFRFFRDGLGLSAVYYLLVPADKVFSRFVIGLKSRLLPPLS